MDVQKFNSAAEEEIGVGRKEISEGGVQVALVRYYRRHDKLVADTLSESGQGIACKSGCSYCCYYKVEARAVEVLQIVNYVKEKCNDDLVADFVRQAQENAAESKDMSIQEQLATNL